MSYYEQYGDPALEAFGKRLKKGVDSSQFYELEKKAKAIKKTDPNKAIGLYSQARKGYLGVAAELRKNIKITTKYAVSGAAADGFGVGSITQGEASSDKRFRFVRQLEKRADRCAKAIMRITGKNNISLLHPEEANESWFDGDETIEGLLESFDVAFESADNEFDEDIFFTALEAIDAIDAGDVDTALEAIDYLQDVAEALEAEGKFAFKKPKMKTVGMAAAGVTAATAALAGGHHLYKRRKAKKNQLPSEELQEAGDTVAASV